MNVKLESLLKWYYNAVAVIPRFKTLDLNLLLQFNVRKMSTQHVIRHHPLLDAFLKPGMIKAANQTGSAVVDCNTEEVNRFIAGMRDNLCKGDNSHIVVTARGDVDDWNSNFLDLDLIGEDIHDKVCAYGETSSD